MSSKEPPASVRPSVNPPPLPSRGPGPKPHVLLIDDNEDFLELNRGYWEEYFREAIELHLLHSNPDSDPVAWIEARIQAGEPLDAVLLDQNMPDGNADTILDRLRTIPAARYVPVVVITAFPDKLRGPASLERGAIRYKYKMVGGDVEAMFLYEAIFDLPQLRDQIEDLMWMDLAREVAEQFVCRTTTADGSRQPACDEKLDEILEWISSFLGQHFGVGAIYVRTKCKGHLKLHGTKDPFGVGPKLLIKDVPFMQRILNPTSPPSFKVDTLSQEEVGSLRQLVGWRMVATSLIVGGERAGTLTLYREPGRHIFRSKDENFLHQLSLEISSHLGVAQERERVRQRQTKLAQFVQAISQAPDETMVADMLADFLYQEVQDGNSQQSKLSVRLLARGTQDIPRTRRRGAEPNAAFLISDLYHPTSAIARVIKERKSEKEGDIQNHPPENGVFITHDQIQSYLAVPLLSSGLCLGAVNLEHFAKHRYSEDDRLFVESVVGLAAGNMVALRARNFLNGLLELVNDLVRPGKRPDLENILSRSFKLLHEFTGYARLLYRVPGTTPDGPWKVARLIGSDGEAMSPEECKKWGRHSSKVWKESFIAKVLRGSEKTYTENPSEIASDEEMGVKTAAMQVVMIHQGREDADAVLTGVLEMLFLLPGSINQDQRTLLEKFGQFIGVVLEAGDTLQNLLDEVTLEGQMAILGRALGQFRHRLKTELFILAHTLDTAEREGWQGQWLSTARAVLAQISEEIANTKSFVKLPEPRRVEVAEVWESSRQRQELVAQRTGIAILPLDANPVREWVMDPDIVGMILENLVQNALEQCSAGHAIRLEVQVTDNDLLLTVCDTGPGVNPAVVDRLFQPGITTKSNGTGFGLHFSRRRARDMGGELYYERARQPGAAFTLKLPYLFQQEN